MVAICNWSDANDRRFLGVDSANISMGNHSARVYYAGRNGRLGFPARESIQRHFSGRLVSGTARRRRGGINAIGSPLN